MTISDLDLDTNLTRLSHAIDQAAALKVELQRLQRHLVAGDPVDAVRLAWMEQIVDEQASVLIECRDQEI